MRRIRVLIVEDSRVVRELLEHVIGQDLRLEVAGSAGSAEEALGLLPRVGADVISMDIRLPGMDGFEATRRIMAERPTPIVVVSASVESEDLKITMNALRAGALSVVEKPVGATHAEYEALAERLCTQLAIMSQVRVVRQRFERREWPGAQSAGRDSQRRWKPTAFRAVGIAASTGGPNALVKLLGEWPLDFPLPILLVQHITASFLEGFTSWLGTVCPFAVQIARGGEIPRPGRVYVAPADRHLRLAENGLQVDGGEPVCFQRPSGTVLFQSMARSLGPQALGVLLTGMGEDGAEGLLEIRRAGGYTIAEDESTAVVYGMPAAAARQGAVCESLPLQAIGPRVLELLEENQEARAWNRRAGS